MNKSKILVGDVVKVIAGSHKGEIGPVTSISKDKRTVSVQGIDVVKHVKPSQTDQEGGIKQIPANINISNIALQDPKNKERISKIGYKIENGKKIRLAKASKSPLKKAGK
ncbi:50S ribosomal protein L24 [Entomoplasma ellychniae]|uniref:Large ribosomal subunit protein uL24 n=2 Tax=Entomoplasmataceae TaxID=33925 RepID=A0A2S5RGW2_9MOLU|nr:MULTISPECIES: 50S ribosomal protein L24 [Entomoplasmataceae]PPE04931.1 50S ribosomal protein L24 [Entomoplasma ellychniae]PPE06538.1 50S ribosomal protein L24 [Mesoplasma corruscae]